MEGNPEEFCIDDKQAADLLHVPLWWFNSFRNIPVKNKINNKNLYDPKEVRQWYREFMVKRPYY